MTTHAARTLAAIPAILLLAAVAPARAQDAGAAVFQQQCAFCHSVAPGGGGGVGPNLRGVAGRKAATTAFAYSAALRQSNIVWTRATLDAFLTAPAKLVPGTQMVVAVPDAAKRAAVVRYLVSMKQ